MTEIEIRTAEQANLDRRLRVVPDGVQAWNAAAARRPGFWHPQQSVSGDEDPHG